MLELFDNIYFFMEGILYNLERHMRHVSKESSISKSLLFWILINHLRITNLHKQECRKYLNLVVATMVGIITHSSSLAETTTSYHHWCIKYKSNLIPLGIEPYSSSCKPKHDFFQKIPFSI